MTLPDPGHVDDPKAQKALDDIRQRFPISAADVAEDIATEAELSAAIAAGVTWASPSATVNAGDSAVEGVATTGSRSDHQHAVSTAAATTLTGSNAEGVATSLARSDHDHALPSSLATDAEVATAVSNHEADTTSVHGIADTTVLATDAEVASAISALSSVYQPLDSDLTAIAALSTTSYGRAFLALANAAAGRTYLELDFVNQTKWSVD